MTHLFVVRFNNSERQMLLALAARDDVTIEEWVQRAALCMAERNAEPRLRSPRRSENLLRRRQSHETTPPLIVCQNCGLDTRPVRTCDNCERALP